MKTTATAKTAFLASMLKAGEQYAGIILGKNGDPDHHLILLPGEADSVNWNTPPPVMKNHPPLPIWSLMFKSP